MGVQKRKNRRTLASLQIALVVSVFGLPMLLIAISKTYIPSCTFGKRGQDKNFVVAGFT
jgi:hypothetical protein